MLSLSLSLWNFKIELGIHHFKVVIYIATNDALMKGLCAILVYYKSFFKYSAPLTYS